MHRDARPQPVWIDLRGSLRTGRVGLGLLLEWRQRQVDGRPPRWEGLVAEVTGGGEAPWSLQVSWRPASELRPVDLMMPADLVPEVPRAHDVSGGINGEPPGRRR
ncbi:unannotated protein [freshwater metagenome]|uniref:Unannotated protein n=1 Tax=freshwater metagenome TaxID=449393 RepID=A0A6J6SEA5_9ZZZZ